MKVSVLASGSKGNSTYIETNNTKILVDLGMTTLYIEKKLAKLDIDPNEIDAIILTHTHVDHISGLKVFCSFWAFNKLAFNCSILFFSISDIFIPFSYILSPKLVYAFF